MRKVYTVWELIEAVIIVTIVTAIITGLSVKVNSSQKEIRRIYFPDFNLSQCDIVIIDETRNKITCGDQEDEFKMEEWHL